MYAEIMHFLESPHIRQGQFEGNELIINKINSDYVILYFEYEPQTGKFEYGRGSEIVYIPTLISKLKEYKASLSI